MSNKNSILYTVPFILLLMLSACENQVSMKTIVNEDGSLEKTITLEKAERHRAQENMFGIHEQNGWSTMITEVEADNANKYHIEFKKNFPSVDAVNLDLDKEADTLFRIHSTFDKHFRWFYTYIRYTETIRPINRFKLISPDDYFNQEDHAFLDRLPGEGTAISKADSVFLEVLNEKISERFVDMGFYYEINRIMNQVVIRNNLDKKWLDTLKNDLDLASDIVESFKGAEGNTKLQQVIDSLIFNNPLAENDLEISIDSLSKRRDFMSNAYYGKYRIEIQMPWKIINSNADSVSGNTVIWRPLSAKFAFKDYTMYAETRKLNTWAVVVSLAVLILTVFLFIRKAKS
jgi:hypothetical protein